MRYTRHPFISCPASASTGRFCQYPFALTFSTSVPGVSPSSPLSERNLSAFTVPATVTFFSRSAVITGSSLPFRISRPLSPVRAMRHKGEAPGFSGSEEKTVATTPSLSEGKRRMPSAGETFAWPSSCMLGTESMSSANCSSVGTSPLWKYDFNVSLSLYLLPISLYLFYVPILS